MRLNIFYLTKINFCHTFLSLNFIINLKLLYMNISQIATFYESAASALYKADEALAQLPIMVKVDDCSSLVIIRLSASTMLNNAQRLFVKDFPQSFSAFIKNPDSKINEFYSLISRHPEILKNCENLFFDFVKAHVEANVSGYSSINMFNWNWDAIYSILSSDYVLDFVKNNAPAAYYSMVSALAKHLDVVKDTNCERAVLFFKANAKLDDIYPDIKDKISKLLKINPNQQSWVVQALKELGK